MLVFDVGNVGTGHECRFPCHGVLRRLERLTVFDGLANLGKDAHMRVSAPLIREAGGHLERILRVAAEAPGGLKRLRHELRC